MKPPKSIPVGGYDYKVIQTNVATQHNCRGQCSHVALEITIEHSLLPNIKDEVFWHEVIHAIDKSYCDQELSEVQVAGLASGLHQVMNSLGVKFDWGK